jgi:hypothetical protein
MFSNGSHVEVLLGMEGDQGAVHGVLRDKHRRPAMSSREVGIRRVIARGSEHPPTESEIEDYLQALATTLKDSVQDSFAENFLAQDRAKGATAANRRAREVVTKAWNNAEALNRISGKSALSSLSDWSKQCFGVSFGVSTLLKEMRRAEVDNEVVDVLSAIEDQTEIITA